MKKLILLFLLIFSTHCFAFKPEMLAGKWINSDLDQLEITVKGKAITLIRDLTSDGIRPTFRRTYHGKFRKNFIPLFAQPKSTDEIRGLLPKNLGRKLIKDQQKEKLIIKIMNQDNLRIDYLEALVNYPSHTPTHITQITTGKEIVRYKRWGRYTIDHIKTIDKNIAAETNKIHQKFMREQKSLNQQISQLETKKQSLINNKIGKKHAKQEIEDLTKKIFRFKEQISNIQSRPPLNPAPNN
jgi:hypothetical protein